jgi:uncharacterized membrane protein HdeD (DUF308 family)
MAVASEARTVTEVVRKSAGWTMAAGVLLILAGILAIAAPFLAALTITIFVGWAMIFGGVAQAIYAFTTKGHTGGMIWKLLLAVLYVFTGGYILFNPVPGIAALTLTLGSVLLVEAVLLAILAFRLRPAPGWGLWLFDAIVTGALALFILVKWPSNSIAILAAFVGVSMIFSGVSRLIFGGTVRAASPKAA